MEKFWLNNYLIIFIFLLIINLVKISSLELNLNCQNLSQIISKDNSELISLIKSNFDSLKNQSHSCIDTLVKYVKIPVLDFYLNELSRRGLQYKENLEISLNTMFTQINDVYNKHKYSEKDYQDVFPASKWAQSLDEIFIEVKFAHRHDSPGCLEMKNLKVEIKDKSVKLVGYCVLGDVPIKMNYYIETYDKINVKDSNHFVSSVGRYQFNLKKKKSNNYWKQLLDDKMTIPTNMRVWFEMKEKYQDQLSKFENEDKDEVLQTMIDVAENRDKKKEKKEKKNKKKKNKKSKKKTTDL
jgi:hypothetical protein